MVDGEIQPRGADANRVALMVAVATSAAFTLWSLACSLIFLFGEPEMVGGIAFDSTVTVTLVLIIAISLLVGAWPALLGLAALRGRRVGRRGILWWLTAAVFLGQAAVIAPDGGTAFLGFYAHLAVGLSAAAVALTLPHSRGADPAA